MTTSRNCLLVSLALTLTLSVASNAAVFSTNSFMDAFVTTGPTGNLSGNNYGAAGALGLSATGSPKGEFQSVLQFDLIGARASFDSQFGVGLWSIQSISLQLTATPTNNAIFNPTTAGVFQIQWMQNDSWIEGAGSPSAPTNTGITFTSLQNAFIGAGDETLGAFSFNGATSGAATYTLNLTSGFSADVLTGNKLSLRLLAIDDSVSYLFNSRNFGTASSRPLITVTAVPEPGVMTLAALGITMLATLKASNRRRNA